MPVQWPVTADNLHKYVDPATGAVAYRCFYPGTGWFTIPNEQGDKWEPSEYTLHEGVPEYRSDGRR